jgi:hypothetical protein
MPSYEDAPAVRHYRDHPLSLNYPTRIKRYLEQDKFWVNAEREAIKIKDMDAEYLLASMIWLMKRSPELYLVMDLAATGGDDMPNGMWMIQQTPLFTKMRQRYLKLTNEPV